MRNCNSVGVPITMPQVLEELLLLDEGLSPDVPFRSAIAELLVLFVR